MKYYDSTGEILLNKSNSVFVKDDDGHDYCIYEGDVELFYTIMEEGYKTDNFELFEKLFPNTTGGDPYIWRKQNLK